MPIIILVIAKEIWSITFSFYIEKLADPSAHILLVALSELVGTVLLIAVVYYWVIKPFLEAKQDANSALLRSEEKYRQTFDYAAVGVAHVGLDGRWLMVNKALSQLVGYTKSELSKLTFQDITHEDDLKDDLRNVERLLKGEINSYDMEKRYLTKTGATRWVQLTVSLVRNEDNTPAFFISVVEDITAKKQTETSAAFLGRIIELSLNEVYIFDADTLRFKSVNFGARKNLGYTAEELESMTPVDIKPEYNRQDFLKAIAPLTNGTSEKICFQTIHQRKDGSDYPVEVHLQLTREFEQSVFVAFILDMTERNRLTSELNNTVRKLEKANRAKSDFLANMSHELRTPLNAIIGFSEVISNQYLGQISQNKYIEYAHDIEMSGKYLLELINDILDLSKIEAGKYTIEQTNIDLAETLDTSVSLLRQRCLDKGVTLEVEAQGSKFPLWADSRAIKQILINLLSNALKFTPSGGKVSVKISMNGDFCQISIQDTGVGIPKDKLKNIISPYVTAHHADGSIEESTGLGLAITHSLILMHGGKMVLQSDEYEGTEVVIFLPSRADMPKLSIN